METCDLVGARQRRSVHRPSYLVLGDVVVSTNTMHDKASDLSPTEQIVGFFDVHRTSKEKGPQPFGGGPILTYPTAASATVFSGGSGGSTTASAALDLPGPFLAPNSKSSTINVSFCDECPLPLATTCP